MKMSEKQRNAVKAIMLAKQKLINKAAIGIWENFGQKEIRALRDEYDISDHFGDDNDRGIARLLNELEDWAMEYTG